MRVAEEDEFTDDSASSVGGAGFSFVGKSFKRLGPSRGPSLTDQIADLVREPLEKMREPLEKVREPLEKASTAAGEALRCGKRSLDQIKGALSSKPRAAGGGAPRGNEIVVRPMTGQRVEPSAPAQVL